MEDADRPHAIVVVMPEPPRSRLDQLRDWDGYRNWEPRRAAGWVFSFALVTYLAFSNGGFDTIPRAQVGVLVWLIVLMVAALGILPRRLGRAEWGAAALLGGFAAWTGVSISWSESAELSADELGRVVTYVGVLLLAVMVVRWSGRRPVINGAACAVGLVGLLAVLSRLHPTWFPVNPQQVFFNDARRLSYPIDYWNGLAIFLAMGVPLLVGLASAARTHLGRAVAAAGVPVLALGMFFTGSDGGAIALGVGVAAYLLLTDDRLAAVGTVVVCGAGAAILIAYASAHPILRHGLRSAAAVSAGDRMIWLILLVCIVIALLQTGVWLAANKLTRPAWLRPPPRQRAVRIAALVAALVLAAVLAGAPGRLERDWRHFKATRTAVVGPGTRGDLFTRFQSAAGNDRYRYWKVAAHVASQHPLDGTGAGTFVLAWARNANAPGYVQDADSLYMQTLAETGYPGLLLIVALVVTLILVGARRALVSPPKTRVLVASATAAVAIFCTSAIYEWVWQLGAITALMLLLGAASIAGGGAKGNSAAIPAEPLHRRFTGLRTRLAALHGRIGPLLAARAARVALAALACCAIIAVALPLAEAHDLSRSRAAFTRGDYTAALAGARSAAKVQPYATSAILQEALVLEATGDYAAARALATKATRDEPANWQNWVILSRLETELGQRKAALADFERAHRLDPQGSLFRP